MTKADLAALPDRSRWLRRRVFDMSARAGQGHLASALSMADILVALFYGVPIRFRPDDPDRDRLIVSKGHATMGVYPILADLGFFPVEELDRYGTAGALLKIFGNISIPGIDATTGSLGHGVGIGCGYAWAAKQGNSSARTYVILSEGELYEGSTWESLLWAAHHELTNLTLIVDRNRNMILGDTEQHVRLHPLRAKFESFGFHVDEVEGHSFRQLVPALSIKSIHVVVAHTIKGKGVSFMEGRPEWHYHKLTPELIEQGREELR
jgi:transketolase